TPGAAVAQALAVPGGDADDLAPERHRTVRSWGRERPTLAAIPDFDRAVGDARLGALSKSWRTSCVFAPSWSPCPCCVSCRLRQRLIPKLANCVSRPSSSVS